MALRRLAGPSAGLRRRLSTALAGKAVPEAVNDPYVASCTFVGIKSSVATPELVVQQPEEYPVFPVFRLLTPDGNPAPGAVLPDLDQATWVDMYRKMCELQTMDTIFYNSQRQGRISFYMTCSGEEAAGIGSAAALRPEDTIVAQYRELGVFTWRGFTIQNVADQLFSNEAGHGKGRQMPMHIGSKDLNIQTISSPLATQLPQAVGAAYAKKFDKEPSVMVCYFGEGAASEGDFHAALNFASTLEVPVIFFCRNNGYAISTSTKEQYRGDGIAARAVGYGMHAIRVDGNDLAAVFAATQSARNLAISESKPVLVEAMTYRLGHHSTSDDSTRYRKIEEIRQYKEDSDPVARFYNFMCQNEWWDAEQEEQLRQDTKASVLKALETAEGRDKPGISEIFSDVYDKKPKHLIEQEESLLRHLDAHPDKY